MGKSIVIAAGGTGGHIYPGLALAEAIMTLEPQARVTFVGTARGLEREIIPAAGYKLDLVNMVPFTGNERFKLPAATIAATAQSRNILKAEGADVAVAMGGYAGFPLMLAAKLLKIPSLIHESGAVPGRANQLAARFTSNVGLAFESAVPAFTRSKDVRVVGMPLRKEFADFNGDEIREQARQHFDVAPEQFLLLAIGGSQGAATINSAASGLAAMWKDRDDFKLVLKAGPNHTVRVNKELEASGGSKVAHCVAFIDKIEFAYAAADFGLFRAGAGTVAELTTVGLPSVLVPYPFAPADHQTMNAQALVDAGAALIVKDHMLSAETLADLVLPFVEDRGKVERMKANALAVARPNASFELARWVLKLASDPGKEG